MSDPEARIALDALASEHQLSLRRIIQTASDLGRVVGEDGLLEIFPDTLRHISSLSLEATTPEGRETVRFLLETFSRYYTEGQKKVARRRAKLTPPEPPEL